MSHPLYHQAFCDKFMRKAVLYARAQAAKERAARWKRICAAWNTCKTHARSVHWHVLYAVGFAHGVLMRVLFALDAVCSLLAGISNFGFQCVGAWLLLQAVMLRGRTLVAISKRTTLSTITYVFEALQTDKPHVWPASHLIWYIDKIVFGVFRLATRVGLRACLHANVTRTDRIVCHLLCLNNVTLCDVFE